MLIVHCVDSARYLMFRCHFQLRRNMERTHIQEMRRQTCSLASTEKIWSNRGESKSTAPRLECHSCLKGMFSSQWVIDATPLLPSAPPGRLLVIQPPCCNCIHQMLAAASGRHSLSATDQEGHPQQTATAAAVPTITMSTRALAIASAPVVVVPVARLRDNLPWLGRLSWSQEKWTVEFQGSERSSVALLQLSIHCMWCYKMQCYGYQGYVGPRAYQTVCSCGGGGSVRQRHWQAARARSWGGQPEQCGAGTGVASSQNVKPAACGMVAPSGPVRHYTWGPPKSAGPRAFTPICPPQGRLWLQVCSPLEKKHLCGTTVGVNIHFLQHCLDTCSTTDVCLSFHSERRPSRTKPPINFVSEHKSQEKIGHSVKKIELDQFYLICK